MLAEECSSICLSSGRVEGGSVKTTADRRLRWLQTKRRAAADLCVFWFYVIDLRPLSHGKAALKDEITGTYSKTSRSISG